MGHQHIGGHVWRWLIVPLDLVRSFGSIFAHYPYHMIHCTIIFMRTWFSSCGNLGNSRLLDRLSYKKIQRYINSSPNITPRWSPQWILTLNFLGWYTCLDTCIYQFYVTEKYTRVWKGGWKNKWSKQFCYT